MRRRVDPDRHKAPALGRVQGSGCRVQGSGFRVQGSGFRVQGSGFNVWLLWGRVKGVGSRVQDLRVKV